MPAPPPPPAAPRRLFALVDASNFYVSCERVFRPDLARRPVVVLSNNDGCVVSRSEEAKRLDVEMAGPYFKVRERFEAAGGVAFSSNYELYADFSRRVLDVLRTITPDVEPYSIDEAFLALSTPTAAHRAPDRLAALAETVARRVLRATRIPVRVSIASTKTLCKVGSEEAKRVARRGGLPAVNLWGRPEAEIEAILRATPIGEVWGIGRAYGRRLPRLNIKTALDLARWDLGEVRRQLRVTGARTAYELRGVSCIPLDRGPRPRRTLMRSRSFGRAVTSLREIREAVATHAARAAERLRREGLAARAVQAFLHTGNAGASGPHRSGSAVTALPEASNHTRDLVAAALQALDRAWAGTDARGRPFPYRKAGVLLLDLAPASPCQSNLFLPHRPGLARLDAAVDQANSRFGPTASGRPAVFCAAEGVGQCDHETETGHAWAMRRRHKSPAYTTRWAELPTARLRPDSLLALSHH